MSARTTDGVTSRGAAWLAVGAGAPLIVARGLVTSTAPPTGLTRWAELRMLTPLAAGRRVLAIGRRPGVRPGIGMASLAAALAEDIRELTAVPVDLLGGSTGGSLALRLAADHPALVRRLVIAAAGPRLGADGKRMQRRCADALAAGRWRRAMGELAPAVADSRVGQTAVRLLLGASGRPADPSGMIAMLLAEDALDMWPRLADLRAPTLIIAAGRDRLYPPEDAERFAAALPHGRFRCYDTLRHHQLLADRRLAPDVLHFLTA